MCVGLEGWKRVGEGICVQGIWVGHVGEREGANAVKTQKHDNMGKLVSAHTQHTNKRAYTHTHTYSHTHIHTRTRSQKLPENDEVGVHTHTHMHTYTHILTHTYTYTHTIIEAARER